MGRRPAPVKRTASLAIRILPELRDALSNAAVKERRSVSGLTELIIDEWLRRHSYLSKSAKPPKR
jgi:hypothetical protein